MKLNFDFIKRRFESGKPVASTPRWLAVVMIVAASMVWVCTYEHGGEKLDTQDERTSADTFIPAGLQLVPLEVENYQALDDILGQTGVADLYALGETPEAKPRKIASRVKILRAPHNPSSFAAVATDAQAPTLVRTNHVYVVVRNPKEIGTEVEVERTNRSPTYKRVIIEDYR